jgi:drug/metabolite transporter (DMT)-like permease
MTLGTGCEGEQLLRVDRGILAAVSASVLFGLSTPLAKTFVGSVPPLLLAGMLYVGSGVGLAALLILRAVAGGRQRITWPQGVDLWWLLGAIAAGGVIGPYLLMYGLRTTDAASASLLLNVEGVFTALLAWFVFKENFDRRVAAGMALIIAGGLALSIDSTVRVGGLVGPLAIGGACLAWAIDNNLTRKVSVHDAMFIACTKGLVAGAASVAIAIAYGAPLPNTMTILRVGLLGFMGYGLSLTLFVVALRRLGTARTGAYFSLAPFFGAALSVVLGAPFGQMLALAGLLMGAGVWLHLTEHHEHWHLHHYTKHAHPHIHDEHHQHGHEHEIEPVGDGPHSHAHVHEVLEHTHSHYPDIHHHHAH